MIAKITYRNEDLDDVAKKNFSVSDTVANHQNEGFSDDNGDGTFTWTFDFLESDFVVQRALAVLRADARFLVEVE